jgi:hypothetical protein
MQLLVLCNYVYCEIALNHDRQESQQIRLQTDAVDHAKQKLYAVQVAHNFELAAHMSCSSYLISIPYSFSYWYTSRHCSPDHSSIILKFDLKS